MRDEIVVQLKGTDLKRSYGKLRYAMRFDNVSVISMICSIRVICVN